MYTSIVGYEHWRMEFITVGTGPFKPWSTCPINTDPGAQSRLLAGRPPYLDQVVVHMNIDPSVQLMVSIRLALYMESLLLCRNSPWKRIPAWRRIVAMLVPACERQLPADKKEVRHAINWAINRERLAYNVVGGMGEPAYAPFPEDITKRIGLPEWYGYDVEKAKALLAEAGYPDGFKTELVVVANEIQRLASEGVQADLAEIGIEVEVRVVESATYTAMMNEGRVPFGNMNVGSQMSDPDEVFMDFLHSSRTPGLNRAAYKNPEFDALVEKARQTVDDQERFELYRQAAEIMMEDSPWAVLYYLKSVAAVKPELKGIEIMPTRPSLRITKAWIDR